MGGRRVSQFTAHKLFFLTKDIWNWASWLFRYASHLCHSFDILYRIEAHQRRVLLLQDPGGLCLAQQPPVPVAQGLAAVALEKHQVVQQGHLRIFIIFIFTFFEKWKKKPKALLRE